MAYDSNLMHPRTQIDQISKKHPENMTDLERLAGAAMLLPLYLLVLLIPAIYFKPIAAIPVGIGVFLLYLVFKFLW